MRATRLLSVLAASSPALVAAATANCDSGAFRIPSAPANATSVAQFTSTASGFDAPKVHPVNSSAFDWWYFDVVSTDPSVASSVVVTFFTSSRAAFPLLDPSDSIIAAYLWVSFPNGTLWSSVSPGTGATVVAEGDASDGAWDGTGFTWTGSAKLGYRISIDAPAVGVKGTIDFRATAPAHYPCGPAVAGQNLQVGPHIGWANAVPDAASAVDLEVSGTHLKFSGAGYHDKNWSDQPFLTHVASWYWGHGRVGPYSIVWFDFLDTTGTEFVSAYASKDGAMLAASCSARSIQVRPVGSAYPPVISTPNPTGYHIALDLGPAHGSLNVNVTVRSLLIGANPEYARFIGSTSAALVRPNGKTTTAGLTGTALFEQFKLTA